MATTVRKKPRKATGYQARPWLKLVPRPKVTASNRARLYLPSGVLELDQEVTSSAVTMSLDEAATVTFTIADPSGSLDALALARSDERQLMSGLDVRWRALWWRVTRIERDEQAWIVVCEDRVAAYLRSHRRPMSASRARTTRAQFVHRLTKAVKAGGGVPVYIPELRERQGIYRPQQPKAKKAAASPAVDASLVDGTVWDSSGGGSGSGASGGWGDAASKVRVKRAQAQSYHLSTIDTVLRSAAAAGANRRVMIACVMCITQESNAGDPRHMTTGDAARRDTIGAFQQGPESISARRSQNVAAATQVFLLGHEAPGFDGTDRGKRGWKQWHGSVTTTRNGPLSLSGMIATVQRPRADLWGEYGKWEREATATVDLWLDRNPGAADGGGSGDVFASGAGAAGAASSPADSDRYYRGQYKFRTSDGDPMDYWDASGALADEVQWHRWAVSNTLGYATDREMIRGNAALWVSRDRDGVHGIRWVWDTRREASQLTARIALADPFQVLPGMVAMVDDEQPVSGRWLVESVDVDPCGDMVADVVLRRPGAKLLEPAPVLKRREGSSGVTIGGDDSYGVFGGDGADGGESADAAGPSDPRSKRARIVAAAEWAYANKQKFSYAQIRPYPRTLRAGGRMDCSAFVTLCYKEAGAADPNGMGYSGAGWTATLADKGRQTTTPKPGDLVQFAPFYTRHVGVYIGDGMMIDFGSNPIKRRPVTAYGTPLFRFFTYPDLDG